MANNLVESPSTLRVSLILPVLSANRAGSHMTLDNGRCEWIKL